MAQSQVEALGPASKCKSLSVFSVECFKLRQWCDVTIPHFNCPFSGTHGWSDGFCRGHECVAKRGCAPAAVLLTQLSGAQAFGAPGPL